MKSINTFLHEFAQTYERVISNLIPHIDFTSPDEFAQKTQGLAD